MPTMAGTTTGVMMREREAQQAGPVPAAGAAPGPARSPDPLGALAGAGNRAVARLLTAESVPGAQQPLLAGLGALHDAVAARFAGLAETEIAATVAAVEQRHQAVEATLEEGLAGVRASGSAARQQVEDAAGSELGALAPAAEQFRGQVLAGQTAATAGAAAELARRQEQLGQAGRDRGAQAAAATEAATAELLTDTAQQTAVSRDTGARASAGANGEDEEVREAQRAAADHLVTDTAQKLAEGAQGTATRMRQQQNEVAAGLTGITTDAAGELAAQLPPLTEHLAAQAAQAGVAVGGIADEATAAVTRQRGSAVAAADQTAVAAAEALRQSAVAHHAALTAAGERGVAEVRSMSTAALGELDRQVAEVAAVVTGQPLPADAGAEFTAEVTGQLGQAGDQFAAQVAGRSNATARGLDGAASTAADALRQTRDQAGETLTGLARGAGDAMTRTGADARTGMAATVREAADADTAATGQFAAALGAQVDGTLPALGDLAAQHQGSLAEQQAQLRPQTAEAARSLEQRISTAQERAAARARRSWLENQLSDLWDTITSPEFLVGLVVGLAVAALIIATAGTATPFVIMAAGVAAGAAGAAAGTITGNIREGRRGWDVFHNVGRNALIGAAAGAAAAGAYLFGAGLVAGLGLTGGAATAGGFVVLEVSAVVANTVGNLLAGEPWDKNLLTALLLAPLIQKLTSKVPGLGGRPNPLAEIDPTVPRVGEWTFRSTTRTTPDGVEIVRIEANHADGRSFGHAERGYNRATGEFQALEMHLQDVPAELRTVQVGSGSMPLSDYLTMRVMRQLQVPVAALNRVRVVEVENVRAVLELERAVRGGTPLDQAVLETQAVAYNERAVVRAGGGRVSSARVTGGQRIPLSELLGKWEGETPPADMVARHDRLLNEFGLTREQAAGYDVRSGFDVELTVVPLGPVVPVPRTDDRE